MTAPQQAVLLIVQQNKTVLYGGGVDAVDGNTSWQGEMNAEQQKKYMALLQKTAWLTTVPESDTNRGTGHYAIELRTRKLNARFTLPLDNKNATSMYQLLEGVAQERLRKHLRALPRPDMDVIIDRKLKNK
ncbi:MAG: hypothetical protein P8N28_01220 [Phycisphaerales bacterium]|nr:hypothetical protein [Phycisphaerales bacterium]